jgi:AraC-like DNA-binding protein
MAEAIFTTMPMFVCLFWASVLLLKFKEEDRAKKTLCIFMLSATFLYFAHCAYFSREYEMIPLTDALYSFVNIAVYPLYYLYIKSLTSARPISWKDFWVLLPAAVLGAASGCCYIGMSIVQKECFVDNYMYGGSEAGMTGILKAQAMIHDAIKIVFAAQIIPVMFFGLRRISSYNRLVMSYFSYTENKSLYQIKHLLIFFVLASISSFVINAVGRAKFAGAIGILAIPSSLFSILLFAIGYIGMKIEFTADELAKISTCNPESYPAEELGKREENDLKKKIIEVMEKKQLYLKPDLKISDLTQLMYTNRNYIYNAINVGMDISFSEFVNRYRVKYAQGLMLKSGETEISEIWAGAGFSSETSFYRNFKLYTGVTPQQWRSEHFSEK